MHDSNGDGGRQSGLGSMVESPHPKDADWVAEYQDLTPKQRWSVNQLVRYRLAQPDRNDENQPELARGTPISFNYNNLGHILRDRESLVDAATEAARRGRWLPPELSGELADLHPRVPDLPAANYWLSLADDRWEDQSPADLVMAVQKEAGELADACLTADTEGDTPRMEKEVDDLAALCVQLLWALGRREPLIPDAPDISE